MVAADQFAVLAYVPENVGHPGTAKDYCDVVETPFLGSRHWIFDDEGDRT